MDDCGLSAVGPERYVSGHIKESAAALADVAGAELRGFSARQGLAHLLARQARHGAAQLLRGPERQLGLHGGQLRHRRR
eukprot:1499604-Pyramimonas_sp.AAC.1